MTSTTTKSSNRYLPLVGAVFVSGVLLFSVTGMPSTISAQTPEQGQVQEQQQQANSQAQNGTRIVEAGGGDAVAPVTWFIPQNVTIRVGETVMWTNPTPVPEPHTITFIREPGYVANLDSAYFIPNGTELKPAVPGEINTEPVIMPGQNGTTTTTTDNIIVAANNRARSPVVIDAQNNVIYLQPNANYAMSGDELFVNSGALWPEGLIAPGAPPVTSFSVTFENAGTYDYLCILHPWMTGQVIVQ